MTKLLVQLLEENFDKLIPPEEGEEKEKTLGELLADKVKRAIESDEYSRIFENINFKYLVDPEQILTLVPLFIQKVNALNSTYIPEDETGHPSDTGKPLLADKKEEEDLLLFSIDIAEITLKNILENKGFIIKKLQNILRLDEKKMLEPEIIRSLLKGYAVMIIQQIFRLSTKYLDSSNPLLMQKKIVAMNIIRKKMDEQLDFALLLSERGTIKDYAYIINKNFANQFSEKEKKIMENWEEKLSASSPTARRARSRSVIKNHLETLYEQCKEANLYSGPLVSAVIKYQFLVTKKNSPTHSHRMFSDQKISEKIPKKKLTHSLKSKRL